MQRPKNQRCMASAALKLLNGLPQSSSVALARFFLCLRFPIVTICRCLARGHCRCRTVQMLQGVCPYPAHPFLDVLAMVGRQERVFHCSGAHKPGLPELSSTDRTICLSLMSMTRSTANNVLDNGTVPSEEPSVQFLTLNANLSTTWGQGIY